MSENFEHFMNNNDNMEPENPSLEIPPLPEDFRQNVIGVWGTQGEEWLQKLPSIINRFKQQWALEVGAPEHKLNYNYVAPARLQDGTEAILKLGSPNPELLYEIDTLTAYDGKKAVRLLKSDREAGAMLLERIRPGKALTALQEQDDEQATTIAATVIRDLSVEVPTEGTFPTIADWGKVFERIRSKELPVDIVPMLDRAERLLGELDQSKQAEKLLHGDLHFENILLDEKNGWVAIDPKGVVGDPTFEAARLLHNPQSLAQEANARQIIERRLEILSSTLNQDKKRLAQWGYVDCMLAASWGIEDNGSYSHVIECAKILEALFEEK